MASIMTLSLDQLAGMWFSDDKQFTLWIRKEQERIEVYYNRKVVLSEPICFYYDEVNNICKVSESVTVFQLHDSNDQKIVFWINTDDYETEQWFNKRQ